MINDETVNVDVNSISFKTARAAAIQLGNGSSKNLNKMVPDSELEEIKNKNLVKNEIERLNKKLAEVEVKIKKRTEDMELAKKKYRKILNDLNVTRDNIRKIDNALFQAEEEKKQLISKRSENRLKLLALQSEMNVVEKLINYFQEKEKSFGMEILSEKSTNLEAYQSNKKKYSGSSAKPDKKLKKKNNVVSKLFSDKSKTEKNSNEYKKNMLCNKKPFDILLEIKKHSSIDEKKKIIKKLIISGYDISTQDSSGTTLLHQLLLAEFDNIYDRIEGSDTLIKFLIKDCGADPNISASSMGSAVDLWPLGKDKLPDYFNIERQVTHTF